MLLSLSFPTAGAQIAPDGLAPRAPLYVTPLISGVLVCNGATRQPELKTLEAMQDWCETHRQSGDLAARSLLDRLEPGGPAGKVRLGHTLLIPLLELFERRNGAWEVSEAKISRYLNAIPAIGRPVVVYLMGNHFDSSSELSRELAADPGNLLAYSTGAAGSSRYIGHGVIPFTLRSEESIPVNRYRFAALRAVSKRIAEMDARSRELIVAVTLAGELHQMFPDFEHGMGAFENIQVTDYSAGSQREFRLWLRQRHGTVQRLNRQLGAHFDSFDAVEPPSLDIRKTPLKAFSQHYDAFAAGSLPLFGWLWDPQQRVQALSLYVDGRYAGPVGRGLERLDVQRARPEVASSSTGFRSAIDFRNMAPGRHAAQIVAVADGKRHLLAEREFVVVPPDQSSTASAPAPARLGGLPEASGISSLQFWLDMPRQLQDVYYNPLAREWDEFRAHQVNQLLTRFYRIARSQGIPARLLYSHQIAAAVHGTWNTALFASDASISNTSPWRAGINLYGASPAAFELIRNRHLRDYGVPEFNPMQGRNAGAARAAFADHYRAGARFVSPFYLSVVPPRLRAADDRRLFDIAPDNTADGADVLYDALEWFVRK